MEEEEIELIEKYLFNKMNINEKTEFENSLKSNPDLLINFNLVKEGILSIKEIDNNNKNHLKKKLNEWDKEENAKKHFFYYAVASISILILSFSFYLFKIKENSFNKYFVKAPGIPNLMSINNNEDSLTEPMNLYKRKKYSECLNLLNVINISKPNNDTVLFYKGICLVETYNYKDALPQFEKISKKINSIYFEKSLINISLLYWKLGDKNQAKMILSKIAKDENNSYRSEAKEILENLSFE